MAISLSFKCDTMIVIYIWKKIEKERFEKFEKKVFLKNQLLPLKVRFFIA